MYQIQRRKHKKETRVGLDLRTPSGHVLLPF
jgi:hypothetical protein